MAPLPDDRLPSEGDRVAPFRSTGIDVAGPFYYKDRRNTIKIWVLLFTCALYRCVHLEPLASLDTDSFLMAFTRFVARRPRPEIVRSDNAGNFVKGSAEIAQLLLLLKEEKLRQKYPQITWIFNPPYAPHTGGFWERLIGVMKDSLKTVVQPGRLTREEFVTVLASTEAAMNNRPLAEEIGASDPKDMELLTPNHFLMGGRYLSLIHI